MKKKMLRRSYCLPESLLNQIEDSKPEHQKTAEYIRNLLVIGLKNYQN